MVLKLYRNFPLVALGFSLNLLVSGEVLARPANFTFTKIADTNSNFQSFAPASMNNQGTVAFKADLDSGSNGVFTGDGTITTTIASSTYGNFSSVGEDTWINDAGTVAFTGLQASSNQTTVGVFTGNGKTFSVIDSRSEQNNAPPVSYRAPSLNNSGVVAFVYAAGHGNILFTANGNKLTNIVGTTAIVENPMLNNSSTVVFGLSGFEIAQSDGTTTTTIANTNPGAGEFVGNASINNSGTVAYVKSKADIEKNILLDSKLLTNKGTKNTTVANISGSYSGFGNTSINDTNNVAFVANLDAGGKGIFLGTNPQKHKVIVTGDSLFGYTVVDLIFSSKGLNNSGQIAFIAKLTNNTQVVVRANPKHKPK